MIVDMMRNDLGRVADVGSVEVPELFTVERYPNVWQMTSLCHRPLNRVTRGDLRRLHPSASVTGAPKVRTDGDSAISNRRRAASTRGPSARSARRQRSFNVAIRTAVVDRRAGTVDFGIGSGIVWDSDPAGGVRRVPV